MIFNSRVKNFILFVFLFSFVAIVNNLIPWVTLPTLGQVLWTLGFAKSIVNNIPFDFYAHDFGYPTPAPISFGLSAVVPIATLIKFGVAADAAYNCVFLIFFLLAYYAVYELSKWLSNSNLVCHLAAALWLILPVITNHADYSMLSLGMALVPFYLMVSFKIFLQHDNVWSLDFLIRAILFFATALLSVFMDGYTFVIMGISAASIFCFQFFTKKFDLKNNLVLGFVLFSSFSLAYFLYASFIGKSGYGKDPIEVFRAWGIDLAYLVIPSSTISWIADYFHLSQVRSTEDNFGDASVWNTTFSLPLILLGVLGCINSVKLKLKYLFISLFLVSFYMSLGPSLKINSIKANGYNELHSNINTMIMPEEYGVMPTGNKFIYENVPGMSSMRATYRWNVLMLISLLLIFLIPSKYNHKNYKSLALLVSILIYIPNIHSSWNEGRSNKKSYESINATLINELKSDIPNNSVVVFVPWGNDFFVNYLAPSVGFKSYNIGGDKNLDIAKSAWSKSLLQLHSSLNGVTTDELKKIFYTTDADFLIIPYIDLIWSAHIWPCLPDVAFDSKDTSLSTFVCPDVKRKFYKELLTRLRQDNDFSIQERDFYAVIKLNKLNIDYPLKPTLVKDSGRGLDLVLGSGWYPVEEDHVWSLPVSSLELPPKIGQKNNNFLKLTFNVFGASKSEVKEVTFSVIQGKYKRNYAITSTDKENKVSFLLPHPVRKTHVIIQVKSPNSPSDLNKNSSDTNPLGISLSSVDISE